MKNNFNEEKMKIKVENLNHTYRTYKREQGISNSIKDLFHRNYIYKDALKNISFNIDDNEIVGIAGPNGAGKTTLLKVLSGLIKPTSGIVKVGDYIPYQKNDDFKKQIGFIMGGKSQLIWELPSLESFSLNQIIYNIPKKDYIKWRDELIETLNVKDLVNVPVRNLSLGQKMKMDIISSLIHHPKVLFLDEPTNGLDVVSRISLREYLKKLFREFGITVIITSHNVGDIENMCDRLMVIKGGEKLYDGNVKQAVLKYAGKNLITVSVCDKLLPEQQRLLDNMKFLKVEELKFQKSIDRETLKQDLKILSDFNIDNISIEEGTLEDALVNVFTSNK